MALIVLIVIVLVGMLSLPVRIPMLQVSETIYIRADGLVEPSTAPIRRNGDLYTLTGNIEESNGIVIERDNMILDGACYTFHGRQNADSQIYFDEIHNVTIRNMKIEGCYNSGINLYGSSNCKIIGNIITDNFNGIHQLNVSSGNTISENKIADNVDGIFLAYLSSNNVIIENNITANHEYGIALGSNVSSNTIYHNNFEENMVQAGQWVLLRNDNVWDGGYLSGGNYWNNYTGRDLYNGPFQNETGGDGIGDTPYIIDAYNRDRYPLMSRHEILDTMPPFISILSPENKTYTNYVPVTFTVSESTSWIGYSSDGQANITITESTTLTDLSNGAHTIRVYASDAAGNTAASETIHFTIEPSPTWIIPTIWIIVGIGVTLLLYFTKFKKPKKKVQQ